MSTKSTNTKKRTQLEVEPSISSSKDPAAEPTASKKPKLIQGDVATSDDDTDDDASDCVQTDLDFKPPPEFVITKYKSTDLNPTPTLLDELRSSDAGQDGSEIWLFRIPAHVPISSLQSQLIELHPNHANSPITRFNPSAASAATSAKGKQRVRDKDIPSLDDTVSAADEYVIQQGDALSLLELKRLTPLVVDVKASSLVPAPKRVSKYYTVGPAVPDINADFFMERGQGILDAGKPRRLHDERAMKHVLSGRYDPIGADADDEATRLSLSRYNNTRAVVPQQVTGVPAAPLATPKPKKKKAKFKTTVDEPPVADADGRESSKKKKRKKVKAEEE
ncbi:hypothetical protein SeLEV6574_g06281 [Synchytrium endobioticum]|uniref:Uncharacterized protein n=1 Tax=Synchytrium endobioticum TaxID=286115 RepID=A0A507CPH9_9FUNG|nr:hypothetical protein SeLEV6574_g06281 [Synchytrium endobioticum]